MVVQPESTNRAASTGSGVSGIDLSGKQYGVWSYRLRTGGSMTRSRSLFCITIVAVVAMSAGMSGASASVPVFHKCGTFTGAVWTVAAFGKKGTTWSVTASGTPCAFAKTWAMKLEKTPNRGEAGTKIVQPYVRF